MTVLVLYRWIPDSFSFCLILTAVALVAGYVATGPHADFVKGAERVIGHWYDGFANVNYLAFAFEMALVMVTGVALASAPPLSRVIDRLARFAARGSTRAAVAVAGISILAGAFSWGFSLAASAILALRVHRASLIEGRTIKLPVLAAAAYMGMIVWHCGLSGSSQLLANDGQPNPLFRRELAAFYAQHRLVTGEVDAWYAELPDEFLCLPEKQMEPLLPENVPVATTTFSPTNLVAFILVSAVILAFFALAGRRAAEGVHPTHGDPEPIKSVTTIPGPFDTRVWWLFEKAIVVLVVAAGVWLVVIKSNKGFLANYKIELFTFACLMLGVLLHFGPRAFARALSSRVTDLSQIVIQFPFYWGILGILGGCGLVRIVGSALLSIDAFSSSPTMFYLMTYLGTCGLHVFVPSGGAQWHIESPVVFRMATDFMATHGTPLDAGRLVLCVAYGNQATNLMQPFWVLPILPMFKLRERDILCVTLLLLPFVVLVYGLVVCFVPIDWGAFASLEWFGGSAAATVPTHR